MQNCLPKGWKAGAFVQWCPSNSACGLSWGTLTPLHFCGCSHTGLLALVVPTEAWGKSGKKPGRVGVGPAFLGLEHAVVELRVTATVQSEVVGKMRCGSRKYLPHTLHPDLFPPWPSSLFLYSRPCYMPDVPVTARPLSFGSCSSHDL